MPAMQSIGIDIGGTKIAIGVIGDDGAIRAQTKIPTDARAGFDSCVRRMAAAADEMLAAAGLSRRDLAGIGIGCTGPVNPFTGVVMTDYTLPTWGGKNLVEALAKEFSLPVRLENDADAALVGEAFAGAGKGADCLVMLTFGTGVGGAAMSGGKLYRGANGEHPEIGHVPIDAQGPSCYCGRPGCLETIACGPPIAEAGKRFSFGTTQEVFAAARGNDPSARAIIDNVIRATQIAVWTIVHTFLPRRLILGGGIMDEHFDLFEPALVEVASAAKLAAAGGLQIRRAQVGNNAGLVGAGFLAFQR